MVRYVFATDRINAIKNIDKVDAQAIGEAIVEANADPRQLWLDARDPEHAAHGCYEWDTQLAAEAHWTSTSRRIIRAIRPLDAKGHEMAIPAFISVKGESGVSYRSHGDVMGSKDLRARVLEQAERDIVALQQKYKHFRELFDSLEAPAATARRLRGRRGTEDRPPT